MGSSPQIRRFKENDLLVITKEMRRKTAKRRSMAAQVAAMVMPGARGRARGVRSSPRGVSSFASRRG